MAVLIEKTYKLVNQKTAQIVDRQSFESGDVLYTCLSSDGSRFYRVTIHAGHATGCTCRELPDGRISPYACYHMAGCEKNEAERSTDIAQHLQDETVVHSCVSCGARVRKANSLCYDCCN